ncbi:MAG: hypothetical protein U0736_15860 [Gemmataceae bacterium]
MTYRLTVDPLDQVDGNAALWLRVAGGQGGVRQTDAGRGPGAAARDTPLDRLPRDKVRAVLDRHAAVLRLADQAALRTRCDWNCRYRRFRTRRPPVQQHPGHPRRRPTGQPALPAGTGRASVRPRRRVIADGLGRAQHLTAGTLLIQDLVGVAVASMMLTASRSGCKRPARQTCTGR